MTTAVQNVFVVSACRTPVGSMGSCLASLKAVELGALAIRTAVQRAGVDASVVQEVFMGHVLQAGCGQAPARQAALGAGLSEWVPCTSVNKVCASGLKAAMLASQSLALNHQQVIVAGGMESMSHVPFYIPRCHLPLGGFHAVDGLVDDGLTDAVSRKHMGLCAEKTAQDLSITRQQQDDYAMLSYSRSADAWANQVFKDEVLAVTVRQGKKGISTLVDEDEEFRRADFVRFPTLRTVFLDNGTVTPANASTLSDGAAAVVLMNQTGLQQTGAKAMAQVVAYSDAAVEPVDFCIAPTKAMQSVLRLANASVDDVALWEINEAFAVTALANIQLMSLHVDKVNIHGGAVSLGHPLGMSGCRILTHLTHALQPGQLGMAAICNGGGGASAMLIRRL